LPSANQREEMAAGWLHCVLSVSQPASATYCTPHLRLGCKYWQLVCQHPTSGKATPAFTKGQPDAKYLSGLNCSLRYQRQRQRGRFGYCPLRSSESPSCYLQPVAQ